MNLRHVCTLLLAALPVVATSCEAPKARVKADGEDRIVDERGAGFAVFDKNASETSREMMDWYTDQVLSGNARTGLNIAFAGVDNQTGEGIGTWRADVTQVLQNVIADYQGFTLISGRYVEAGMTEANMRRSEDFFVPSKKRKFLEVMERGDNPVAAMVWCTLTQANASGGDLRESRYRMTLELVDVGTGTQKSFQSTVSKEYRR